MENGECKGRFSPPMTCPMGPLLAIKMLFNMCSVRGVRTYTYGLTYPVGKSDTRFIQLIVVQIEKLIDN
jgi:hypothetical protein